MTWSLVDFRLWWQSPSRHRWLRALGLAPSRAAMYTLGQFIPKLG